MDDNKLIEILSAIQTDISNIKTDITAIQSNNQKEFSAIRNEMTTKNDLVPIQQDINATKYNLQSFRDETSETLEMLRSNANYMIDWMDRLDKQLHLVSDVTHIEFAPKDAKEL